MKKLHDRTALLAVRLIFLLVAGCSQRVDFEGVDCIKTVDIVATDMECNWDKYNLEHKGEVWLN